MTFKRVLVGLAALAAFAPDASFAAEPATPGGPPMVRRLTPAQYQSIIADVFGPDIKIGGRFEPDKREDGLLAVGTGHVSIAVSGLTQYDAMARTIADQVVDKEHRATLALCKPKRENVADEACARQFLGRAGRLLFRRPMGETELGAYAAAAGRATERLNDFYAGVSLSLAGMLASPEFLFRKEVAEPDPARKGQYRLDGHSKAARLSFFLWNTGPDEALLTAAATGELHTNRGLKKQVDRMLASPRMEAGVRAYFIDMLQFDRFESLQKDPMLFPNFTPGAVAEAQEQTLRTIVDHLVTRGGDYRDLFTTRRTFLTPLMGSVYNVPVPKVTANGAPNQWLPFEYPADDPRAIGILAHASFTALHSHPGRSSATLRGKAVRELLLCQKVPDPPGNVNFTVVQDTNNPDYKTARERLKAHATDAMCTGCHKITDPVGLALEHFDSGATYRPTENGAAIDLSGEINGRKYNDAFGLARALHDDPAATSCLVNKTYAFAAGRAASKADKEWIDYQIAAFAKDGHRFPGLMARIALSDAFTRVKPDVKEANASQTQLAANNSGMKE